MFTIENISKAFVLLVRLGAATRGSYCLFIMSQNQDEFPVYKKRFINTLIFFVLSEMVWVLKELADVYFKPI